MTEICTEDATACISARLSLPKLVPVVRYLILFFQQVLVGVVTQQSTQVKTKPCRRPPVACRYICQSKFLQARLVDIQVSQD